MIYTADVTSLWTLWWTGGTVKPTDASSESTKQLCAAPRSHHLPPSHPPPSPSHISLTIFFLKSGEGGGGGVRGGKGGREEGLVRGRGFFLQLLLSKTQRMCVPRLRFSSINLDFDTCS